MEAEKRNKGAVNMSMTGNTYIALGGSNSGSAPIMAMTGDAYTLPIEITFESGKATLADFLEIEVTVGSVRKLLSTGDVVYDEETGNFLVKFTQKETMKLKGKRDVDVRLVLVNEDSVGKRAGILEHEESQSRQVI